MNQNACRKTNKLLKNTIDRPNFEELQLWRNPIEVRMYLYGHLELHSQGNNLFDSSFALVESSTTRQQNGIAVDSKWSDSHAHSC